jgi:hypothetical protein
MRSYDGVTDIEIKSPDKGLIAGGERGGSHRPGACRVLQMINDRRNQRASRNAGIAGLRYNS